jgi:hypothetical protein
VIINWPIHREWKRNSENRVKRGRRLGRNSLYYMTNTSLRFGEWRIYLILVIHELVRALNSLCRDNLHQYDETDPYRRLRVWTHVLIALFPLFKRQASS